MEKISMLKIHKMGIIAISTTKNILNILNVNGDII